MIRSTTFIVKLPTLLCLRRRYLRGKQHYNLVFLGKLYVIDSLARLILNVNDTGRALIVSLEEEEEIVQHVKTMASYGYGYTRQDVTDKATDYAHTINSKPRNEVLTLRLFEDFMNRCPELKVLKPRNLEIARAKCGTIENVEKYFDSLEEDFNKYGLQNKPHLICNVDEKELTSSHKPSNVVSGIECHTTSAVTSGKSSTTTVLGCGNASGFAVPPYFVLRVKK